MTKTVYGILFAVFAMTLHADYMQWQIVSFFEGEYDSARLMIYDTSTDREYTFAQKELTPTGDRTDAASLISIQDEGIDLHLSGENGITVADLGDNFRYYVELGNYNNGVFESVAHSDYNQMYTYQALKDGGCLTTNPLWQELEPLVFDAFVPAPEPGSAGLMIFGLALLALKRKRA